MRTWGSRRQRPRPTWTTGALSPSPARGRSFIGRPAAQEWMENAAQSATAAAQRWNSGLRSMTPLSLGIVRRPRGECKRTPELDCAPGLRMMQWVFMPKRSPPKRAAGTGKKKGLEARLRELEEENRLLRSRLEGIPASRLDRKSVV